MRISGSERHHPLLPSAVMRTALAAAVSDVDAALGSQVRSGPAAGNGAGDNSVRADDERFAARAELQFQLWDAALRHTTNPDFDALRAARTLWNQPVAPHDLTEEASLAYRRERLETALADLVRGLPARLLRGAEEELDLSSPPSRATRLSRLRRPSQRCTAGTVDSLRWATEGPVVMRPILPWSSFIRSP